MTLGTKERKGRESSLAGGVAKAGFLKEVTQAESGQPLKWGMCSKHVGQEKESMFRSLQ